MNEANRLIADITLEGQIKELSRELQMRSQAFPRWVKQGRLSQEEADYRIAALQAAITTLKGLQTGIIS